MITIFNRSEIKITRKLKERIEICDLLESNGIPTRTYVRGMEKYRGIPGLKFGDAYEYTIYVHRKDYEKAKYMLSRYQKSET